MSVLLSALLLASADPATAPSQPAAPAPVQKVAEKKVCRTDTDDSVSRLRRRVCMTQNEWNMHDQGTNLSARAGSSSTAQSAPSEE